MVMYYIDSLAEDNSGLGLGRLFPGSWSLIHILENKAQTDSQKQKENSI